MTIGEKSTELGIDLAQIALDTYGVVKCLEGGSFHCFTTTEKNALIAILDDNGNRLHRGSFKWNDDALAENSTLAIVEQAFKDYIDAQELIPAKNNTTYQEIN
jgi:hypothetical protein